MIEIPARLQFRPKYGFIQISVRPLILTKPRIVENLLITKIV